jgi:hypothetical protein
LQKDRRTPSAFRWHAPATPGSPPAVGFGFEFDETAHDLPPVRRRPRSLVHADTFREREQFCRDPDKWPDGRKKRQPK